MTVSDEAVEAAINALYPNGPNEFVRKGWELTVRTILEAAAPFMTNAPGPTVLVEEAKS